MNGRERDYEEEIIEILEDHLNLPSGTIDTDKFIVDDLGANSIEIIELVIIFENEYGIEITDSDYEQITTVESLTNYIKRKTDDPTN